MAPDDVTVRGITKILRQLKARGSDLKNIRNKGFTALSCPSERALFRGMFATVESVYKEFLDRWEAAVEYTETHGTSPSFPSADDEAYLAEIKQYYYETQSYHIQVMTKIQLNVSESSSTSANLNVSGSTAAVHSRTILPKIPIKHFQGDIAQWPSFKQLFTSLIKEECTLSDAERFHYLTSYLGGPAYDTIKHITAVGENFEQAWGALVKMYDDPRKLACTYLEKFLTFKPHTGKPTPESLQAYLSNVSESIVSLKNLPIPNLSDYILCELALRSLDSVTRELYEMSNVDHNFPSFTGLQTFVQNRCHVLRITQPLQPCKPEGQALPIKSSYKYVPRPSTQHALVAHLGDSGSQSGSHQSQHPSRPCHVCRQEHRVLQCPCFQSATPAERLDLLRRFSGCRNCLHPAHRTRDCQSAFSCRICRQRHHTELHLTSSTNVEPEHPTAVPSDEDAPPSGFAGTSVNGSTGVLLGTVVARIRDAGGHFQRFRGILDPGSMFSFVTEDCARKLNRSMRSFRGSIAGVNNSPLCHVKGQMQIEFIPRLSSSDLQTEAIVVPSITPPLPQAHLTSSKWVDYTSHDLSDPEFTNPGPVSFLIGADLYPDIVTGLPIVIHDDGPRIMNTVFGYVVTGRYSEDSAAHRGVSLLTHGELGSILERFWEIEETALPLIPSPDDEQCEQHFLQTHSRTDDGRYMVSLPFRTVSPQISPNTKRALNCFYSLESRLGKDEVLQQEYHAQMEEYKQLGHMSLATGPPSYVIPHHAVYKVNGESRKLRIVFDASFKTSTGSLNDHLLTGPKLQADLTAILLNFRCHSYVFSCDIIKMFRQILLHPNDRKYQQVIWRSSPKDPIQFYELNTVTFGISSSPYLAQRVLRQHALNHREEFPDAATILLNSTYIDDIIGGSDDPQLLMALKHQLIELLARGGFTLSKWSSNYLPLLSAAEKSDELVPLCSEETLATKILGMQWDPNSDLLSYRVLQPPDQCTKRSILSTIARLYDPLGYLAPIIFRAKCMLQLTWQTKLDWDEEVPEELGKSWSQFIAELPSISSISIPRAFPKTDSYYQLMCFSDASASGYCASVYLRSTQGNNTDMTLVKAKTKLAPLKSLTIPRLELCGALLLAQLLRTLSPLIKDLNIQQIYCFSDSTTVLSWINTLPHLLQTFVSNRVQQILSHTEASWWHHIKGIENPADVGSRGITPSALCDHDLWWKGPHWSMLPLSQWPITREIPLLEIPEMKPFRLTLVSVESRAGLIDYAGRHSSHSRFIRVIAYIKRFINNCRLPKRLRRHRVVGPIAAPEFQRANKHYLQILQHFYFPTVYTKSSFNDLSLELRRLNVFIDHEGLIRVGGRLVNAPIPYDHKHPILLPARSFYTNLVVNHFHSANHHAGTAALLASIRQQYWIPNAKNLLKYLKHKCVVCTRFSKSSLIPFMGNLPRSRFASSRPFLITGVDFAGPFLYRSSRLRRACTEKSYLCLFICMTSRALHLEIALSLSVEGFLDAFDRFVARRGLPAEMLSDGGTNFRGTDRYLRELMDYFSAKQTKSSLVHNTSHLGVKWTFNPPSSPHFGGGWEVSVRIVKDLLSKTFGGHSYTLPELTTAITKIEGILNSRPIQPLSSNPEDLEPLTPGHFIIGQPLNALPDPDFEDIPANRLNCWQRIRERIQYFWARWRAEYLSSLQVRQKWDRQSPNLKPGALVLLRDENSPPTQWPLARIQEVHPGLDGVVRVATIHTRGGVYKRPIVKMLPLALSDIHA